MKPSKIGSTQNETDRTASYERVSIHLKVNALGLKLLNLRQSDQALHFLLVGYENITIFSRLTGLMLTGKYNVATAIQFTYCKNSEYSRTSTLMARTLIARLPQLFRICSRVPWKILPVCRFRIIQGDFLFIN